MQPDVLTAKHRDGERNPLERPQVSEDEDKVVADKTLRADQEGDFVFQTEVEMNLETSQVAARHFELAMFRQKQGTTTAKSTDRGGDYPIQAHFGGNPKATTAQQVSAREDAVTGRHQRGTTSTEQNKQFDRGR